MLIHDKVLFQENDEDDESDGDDVETPPRVKNKGKRFEIDKLLNIYSDQSIGVFRCPLFYLSVEDS